MSETFEEWACALKAARKRAIAIAIDVKGRTRTVSDDRETFAEIAYQTFRKIPAAIKALSRTTSPVRST